MLQCCILCWFFPIVSAGRCGPSWASVSGHEEAAGGGDPDACGCREQATEHERGTRLQVPDSRTGQSHVVRISHYHPDSRSVNFTKTYVDVMLDAYDLAFQKYNEEVRLLRMLHMATLDTFISMVLKSLKFHLRLCFPDSQSWSLKVSSNIQMVNPNKEIISDIYLLPKIGWGKF